MTQRLIDAIALDRAMYEEAFEKDSDMQRWDSGCWIRYKLYERVLDAQPTVDAEPVRHGMFIGTEFDGYADGNPVYYEWKCSECGCIFEEDEPTYRYCPNCGAKMDKLQESEE